MPPNVAKGPPLPIWLRTLFCWHSMFCCCCDLLSIAAFSCCPGVMHGLKGDNGIASMSQATALSAVWHTRGQGQTMEQQAELARLSNQARHFQDEVAYASTKTPA